MVVISASVCDKQGKIIIARQFQNITKQSLEENIKNFPKIIVQNQQHTFVETSNMRYVYLPLEDLYLLLMTNKNSNIIDDLETIRLLHKLVIQLVPNGLTDVNVQENAFEILLAFDDVICFGCRESVTLTQVEEALAMNSSEEKMHRMLMITKQNEAKEAAKKHIRETERKKAELGGLSPENDKFMSQKIDYTPTEQIQKIQNNFNEQPKPSSLSTLKKGLQLGKKKVVELKTEKVVAKQETKQAEELIQQDSKQSSFNPLKAPVSMEIKELLSCQITKEGALQSFEIIGEVFLKVNHPNKTKCQIQMAYETDKKITIKPHPNLNKQLWTKDKLIAVKDQNDGFPYNVQLSALKYKYSTSDISEVPFTFTFWHNGNTITLELEYAQQDKFESLQNLFIDIPADSNCQINSIEQSSYKFQNNQLEWNVPELSSDNPSANMEIQFGNSIQAEDLFPFVVRFQQNKTFYDIKTVMAKSTDDNEQIKFEETITLSTDKFYIV